MIKRVKFVTACGCVCEQVMLMPSGQVPEVLYRNLQTQDAVPAVPLDGVVPGDTVFLKREFRFAGSVFGVLIYQEHHPREVRQIVDQPVLAPPARLTVRMPSELHPLVQLDRQLQAGQDETR